MIASKFCMIAELQTESSTNAKSGSNHKAYESLISRFSAVIVSFMNSPEMNGSKIQKLKRLEMKSSK